MTKENRERQYLNFRNAEKNYEAAPGRDHDLEKTPVVRAKAKKDADAMLKKRPELAELEKTVVKETKSKEKK